MARAAVYAVLAGCAAWLGGCGTISNFKESSGPNVYGGIRDDALAALMTSPLVAVQDSPGAALMVLPLHALVLADLPLSAAADTLLLPITLHAGKPRPPFPLDTGNEQPKEPVPATTPAPEHASDQGQQPAPAAPATPPTDGRRVR
jgi:uncharacterized protein YceK